MTKRKVLYCIRWLCVSVTFSCIAWRRLGIALHGGLASGIRRLGISDLTTA